MTNTASPQHAWCIGTNTLNRHLPLVNKKDMFMFFRSQVLWFYYMHNICMALFILNVFCNIYYFTIYYFWIMRFVKWHIVHLYKNSGATTLCSPVPPNAIQHNSSATIKLSFLSFMMIILLSSRLEWWIALNGRFSLKNHTLSMFSLYICIFIYWWLYIYIYLLFSIYAIVKWCYK